MLLDGGFGTMVQALGLKESDWRGREFIGWTRQLAGCTDVLCLSQPRTVAGIHRAYLAAGADIISTNSFNANAISLQEYGLEAYARRIARSAAQIARSVADEFEQDGRPRYVAGSMGPTSKTASIAAKVGDSSSRDVTFATLTDAYYEQAQGLIEGGADLLLLETVFDTLNAKAAIFALEKLFGELGRRLPLMISVTVSQKAGRTLSGQSIEAFWTSVAHARPLSVGINCSFGAREMMPHLERLAAVADCYISVHPNAGLPNISGGYDETPESFAEAMRPFVQRGLVNIMGGCCGTTPEFIKALAGMLAGEGGRAESCAKEHSAIGGFGDGGQIADTLQDIENASPSNKGRHFAQNPTNKALALHRRKLPERDTTTVLSGLEVLRIVPEANFINIGERCNVAGSAKFARLIREGNLEEALAIARAQVAAGAQVIDICMDDGLIDGPAAMRQFVNMIAGEVDIARVPLMIDSSSPETIIAGLECCQGKAIVNSISLKEGPDEFLRRASLIRAYGAAAVVMLFDETGQATSLERKIQVAGRAYKLLVESGFPAQDIIFDPNILAVATGIEEHDGYALAFIEATRWIKDNLPGAKVSGGVSNLSFAFRGNNTVREAMHSAFLYHARRAGMDMGIVNPQMLKLYDDIEPRLLELVEDVILCRRRDASERLSQYASDLKATQEKNLATAAQEEAGASQAKAPWRSSTAGERISYAMLHGIADYIECDVLEALAAEGSPMAVIGKMMMPAMEHIGTLFGEGKMFLPQVVKAAAVMKRGVAALEPHLAAGGQPFDSQQDTQTNPLSAGGGYIQQLADSQQDECQPAASGPVGQSSTGSSSPGAGSRFCAQAASAATAASHSAGPKVVIATVKGDIHDIGKNIVSVVMAVGGCEIIDLGVMVEPEAIVEAVRSHKADFVCLSGLITPSLAEMVNVCRHLRAAGISIPVIVGGATTSPMHTAVKIATEYDGLVIHSPNASRNMQIITSLMSPTARVFAAGILAEQKQLRQLYASAQGGRRLASYRERLQEAINRRGAGPMPAGLAAGSSAVASEPSHSTAGSAPGLSATHPSEAGAQSVGTQFNTESYPANSEGVISNNSHIISHLRPSQTIRVFHHYDFAAVRRHIDWDMFYAEWGVKDAAAREELRREAGQMLGRIARANVLDLQGVIATFAAHADGDDIVLNGIAETDVPASTAALAGDLCSPSRAAHPEGFSTRPDGLGRNDTGSSKRTSSPVIPSAVEGSHTAGEKTQSQSITGSDTHPAHLGRNDTAVRLPMLRNQTDGAENLSVADFVAAAGRLTLFAISAGVGLKAFAEQLTAEGDQYGAFMVKVLADCLAEALAAEVVPAAEGERHAFGYPSCPDHSLKKDVLELLQVGKYCDMSLTDSYMIDPAESICGMVIPGAGYFAVGKIGQDQLEDYARRRNMSIEQIKSLIPRNIL